MSNVLSPGIDGGQDGGEVLLDDHAVAEEDQTLLSLVQSTVTCGRRLSGQGDGAR